MVLESTIKLFFIMDKTGDSKLSLPKTRLSLNLEMNQDVKVLSKRLLGVSMLKAPRRMCVPTGTRHDTVNNLRLCNSMLSLCYYF